MVPGFAERERRIADAQRRDWLAEVAVGLERTASSLARGPGSSRSQGISMLLRWHRLLPELRDLQLAIDVALRKSTSPMPERALGE